MLCSSSLTRSRPKLVLLVTISCGWPPKWFGRLGCGSATQRYKSTRCPLPLQSGQSASNGHLSTLSLHSFLVSFPTQSLHNALHHFDYPFLCSLCYLFQCVSLPNYVPTTFLTLFAAMAYAAPVAPQGAIFKRQCIPGWCRDAVSVGGCLYKRVLTLLNFVDRRASRFRF